MYAVVLEQVTHVLQTLASACCLGQYSTEEAGP
jgi:hypothetical protein